MPRSGAADNIRVDTDTPWIRPLILRFVLIAPRLGPHRSGGGTRSETNPLSG